MLVDVVVLTLTRIIKSVVTGQAPVTLELRNTLGKKQKQPKVVHAYITSDAIVGRGEAKRVPQDLRNYHQIGHKHPHSLIPLC